MNAQNRNIMIWIAIGIALVFFVSQAAPMAANTPEPWDSRQFQSAIDSGSIEKVEAQGNMISADFTVTHDGGKEATYYSATVEDDLAALKAADVAFVIEERPAPSSWFNYIYMIFMIGLIGFIIYSFRSAQRGGGGGFGMGFGRSKAKLLTENENSVLFEDVAGVEESKQEVEEVVQFLKDPGRFQRLGAKIPRGLMLVGPPGTGKTLLAKAIAGESGVPFFSISGSDFVEMFVGVGASRVRDMFEQAKKNSPCIIFIDEIDAVGRARSQGFGGSNQEQEQTLNQLLVEMDGFEENEGVIVVAATNRVDTLDKALLRPGRFDRQVQVPLPDVKGREQILRVHSRNVPLADNVDLKRVAKGTPTFSGADLANLINEAALLTARTGKRLVTQAELENAKDKITMGPERRSQHRTKEEIELVAYHEAGHAITSLFVPLKNPLNKLTIIPRGGAGGYAQFLPESDAQMLETKEQFKANLVMSFGGRLAEEVIYGPEHVTAGAVSDIRQSTQLAKAMVEQFGFSEKLGMRYYGHNQSGGFVADKNYSEGYSEVIDSEVRQLLDDAETRAREILMEHKETLHRLKDALLEYETLSGEEVKIIVEGGTINRDDDTKPTPPRSGLAMPKIGKKPQAPSAEPSAA